MAAEKDLAQQPEQWLLEASERAPHLDTAVIKRAYTYVSEIGSNKPIPYAKSSLSQGLRMADQLIDLNCDLNTLVAAIVYPCFLYQQPSKDELKQHFGVKVLKLLQGVQRMDALHSLFGQQTFRRDKQVDNVRKMLLAMVDDIRVVLIKLSEQLAVLKSLRKCPAIQQQEVARQVMSIYAPLANRLGLGQLKWQLEDFAFRYTYTQEYAEISQALKMRRQDRENLINDMIKDLEQLLRSAEIEKFEISGRAKHIYSIYRKIQRKQVGFSEIYDQFALRVLLPTIEDCYTTLSLAHGKWSHIQKEFDDYIAKPKSNGYRSIHTAVIGPSNVNIEIQIRTFNMHAEAELGVAAHWKYKEGSGAQSDYEDKINWLREVMDWQKEVVLDDPNAESALEQIFSDRVYVFTPQGDIFDMQTGATPLDFAYHVHTDVGHRCKGAKVNDVLVQLTHPLQTGDRVEILTGKEPNPSRDWLQAQSGYLTTNHARAKVRHWFKQLDYRKHHAEGEVLWEKAARRAEINKNEISKACEKFNFKTADDLLAAIGANSISANAVLQYLKHQHKPDDSSSFIPSIKKPAAKTQSPKLEVAGIDDLLTQLARCCKPIPGDPILGYITKGRGVTIHHRECQNMRQAIQFRPERVMEVEWGSGPQQTYPVDLVVEAIDRPALIRDVTGVMANANISMTGLTSRVNKLDNIAYVNITVEMKSLEPLQNLLNQLRQVEGVLKAKRR